MVDATSNLEEDVDEESAPACEQCGTKIVKSPTHRVVAWVESGRVHRAHFCGDECRTAWLEERR